MASKDTLADDGQNAGTLDAGSAGTQDPATGTGESEAIGSAFDAEQPDREPKKRRGRRSKAELEAAGYYDGKAPRKTAAKVVPVGAKELAGKIKGVHHFAAIFTGIPVLQLNDEESEQLASASLAVLAQYDMAISPLAAAWVNLAATLGMIYGVRIYAYKNWKDEQKVVAMREAGKKTEFGDIEWGNGEAA